MEKASNDNCFPKRVFRKLCTGADNADGEDGTDNAVGAGHDLPQKIQK